MAARGREETSVAEHLSGLRRQFLADPADPHPQGARRRAEHLGQFVVLVVLGESHQHQGAVLLVEVLQHFLSVVRRVDGSRWGRLGIGVQFGEAKLPPALRRLAAAAP